ncbi:MAG: hypothetical protein HWN80_02855 [Candidatus Lokiarchaeota archaeon]|nr:hypothetical protein [Candidatus Lokiarchaeota archaeon]
MSLNRKKENLKKFATLGFGGVFLIVLGVISIINISPYKDCGFLDFFCPKELKSPNELFFDHIGPVFIIILGSLAIIVLILIQSKSFTSYLRERSQRSLSEEEERNQ